MTAQVQALYEQICRSNETINALMDEKRDLREQLDTLRGAWEYQSKEITALERRIELLQEQVRDYENDNYIGGTDV